MSIENIIDEAVKLNETGEEEKIWQAVKMLEKEYPNYKNHERFTRNYAAICSNYGSKSTRKDFEGYCDRNACMMTSLSVHKDITLERMDARTAWLLYTANMAGFTAVFTEDIDKMEKALALVRQARTRHLFNPIEDNVTMMERGLPSMQAYVCCWLATEYMKSETEDLPRASALLTEAYKIRVNELKSDIRNIDVNPNVSNDKDKVILTTKHITDAKQTVNNTYMNRTEPVRPGGFASDGNLNDIFGDIFGGGTSTTQKTTPRFCGNCGKPLNPGDRFCGNCGSPIK